MKRVALFLLLALPVFGDVSPEYKVKAVLLFNFAKFVSWPAESLGGQDAPIIIGVLGDDPFGGALEDAIRGRNAGGHPIAIRRYERLEDVKGCHLLFISASEKSRQAEILSSFKTNAVLTVGDTEDFIQQGGMIKVTLVDRKPHLQIDARAAERVGLKIQAQLLELAKEERR